MRVQSLNLSSSLQIVHCDLALRNIMVNKFPWEVKVAEFSLARDMNRMSRRSSRWRSQRVQSLSHRFFRYVLHLSRDLFSNICRQTDEILQPERSFSSAVNRKHSQRHSLHCSTEASDIGSLTRSTAAVVPLS